MTEGSLMSEDSMMTEGLERARRHDCEIYAFRLASFEEAKYVRRHGCLV